MLIVLLVIGILSATGAGFFRQVARDTRLRTIADTLAAFLGACRSRAEQRGLPITLEIRGQRLVAAEAPALSCPLPPLVDPTRSDLHGLRFAGTQCWRADGMPLQRLELLVRLPGEGVATVSLTW
ncbi:MAG: hypothetical protein OZSIB_3404 [Candidatus Ozemobacter sibiricus]|uniref:General secretion pathway GspH domain-containing protein n=1 Tax=Candidatus Ozemobacter sibiricus TaxID=2268124 RepID=A0A367ZS66_9BACT|nr:MAG: hypothetical protein OZSIB_3404 [Candidatus Ozemobacter sibiricus]